MRFLYEEPDPRLIGFWFLLATFFGSFVWVVFIQWLIGRYGRPTF